MMNNSTIDNADIFRFAKVAQEWWNPLGSFKVLHQINPLRVSYIKQHAPDLQGLRVLDIGCGGGLVAEAMARLGAIVTAIDATESNIKIAIAHAQQSNLNINYQFATAEELVARGETYDVVLALEVIEHVANVDFFLTSISALVSPQGTLFISTINRTMKSLVLAKFAAEYVLNWVPRGTHQWQQFLRPSQIIQPLQQQNFTMQNISGMIYHPLKKSWSWSKTDISMNYMVALIRQ